MKFPFQKKILCKNRKTKQYLVVTITVFDYQGKTPHRIYTSKQIFEKRVVLLLLPNSKNSIKDFDRFMTNKTKHHGNKHFC